MKAMLATVTDAPARASAAPVAGRGRAAAAATDSSAARSLRGETWRVMNVARPGVGLIQAVQALRSISATRKASSSDCTRLSRGSQTDS